MSLKTFTAAYIETALWSSVDESSDQGGAPLDKNYDPDDIAPDTRKRMEKDCREFYAEWEDAWTESAWSDWQAGHDFWLSRNGHGAGFFDRYFRKGSTLGTLGPRTRDALQKAAKAYGSFDLYVGDDGKVHGS